MFDALKTEYWIAEYIRLPEHKWQLYLDFSKKDILKTGGVQWGLLSAAVYLNIHIVLQPKPQHTGLKNLSKQMNKLTYRERYATYHGPYRND